MTEHLDALEARAEQAREQMMHDQKVAHLVPALAHQAKQCVDWTPTVARDGTPMQLLDAPEAAHELMVADMTNAHLVPAE